MNWVNTQRVDEQDYTIIDTYLDPSTDKTVGGRMKIMMMDGQVLMEQEITP